jgi:hypothetical protein
MPRASSAAHAARVRAASLLLFVLSLASLVPLADAKRKSRAEERAAKSANTQFGLTILAVVLILVFLPPLVLCVYEAWRDPATPVLARLLWLRVKELVGYDPSHGAGARPAAGGRGAGSGSGSRTIATTATDKAAGRALADLIVRDAAIRKAAEERKKAAGMPYSLQASLLSRADALERPDGAAGPDAARIPSPQQQQAGPSTTGPPAGPQGEGASDGIRRRG